MIIKVALTRYIDVEIPDNTPSREIKDKVGIAAFQNSWRWDKVAIVGIVGEKLPEVKK